VNTNEVFSVRLVQSPNPEEIRRPGSSWRNGVSPLLGGMGIRGAIPTVNVRPPTGDDGGYNRREDSIGTFSEGSSGVQYEGHAWEERERAFARNGRYSGLGSWKNNMTNSYSVDSFQSNDRNSEEEEGHRRTWYKTKGSSHDTVEDAIEYSVSKVSGPLSPVSANVEWNSRRRQRIEYAKERSNVSGSTSGNESGEVAFV